MDRERKHIRGIVDELMNNSLKAKATKIDVQVEQLATEVRIRVSDNGKGMTGDKLEQVKKHLNQPRRDELEEYYGVLAGESMVGTGLSLVGMITDRAEVKTVLGEGTEVIVYRKLRS